jgi:hypothetical protein
MLKGSEMHETGRKGRLGHLVLATLAVTALGCSGSDPPSGDHDASLDGAADVGSADTSADRLADSEDASVESPPPDASMDLSIEQSIDATNEPPLVASETSVKDGGNDAADDGVDAADGGSGIADATDVTADSADAPTTCRPSSISWWLPDGGVNFDGDPANCGMCGRSCLSGLCSKGQCVLAAGQIHAITQDASNIYYITRYDGRGIFKVDKTGATAPIRLASTAYDAYGIAVDGSAVYWMEGSNFYRVGKEGVPDGGFGTLVYDIPPTVTPVGEPSVDLVIDGMNAYVQLYTAGGRCPLVTFPLTGVPDGGDSTVLTLEGPHSHAYPVFDADYMYWQGPAGLCRMPKLGGATYVISPVTSWTGAAGSAEINGMVALANGWAYWPQMYVGIFASPVDSVDGGGTTQLTTDPAVGRYIVTDGVSLYWLSNPANGDHHPSGSNEMNVMKRPLAGGNNVLVERALFGGPVTTGPLIVVDNTNVYWVATATTYGRIGIFRAPK